MLVVFYCDLLGKKFLHLPLVIYCQISSGDLDFPLVISDWNGSQLLIPWSMQSTSHYNIFGKNICSHLSPQEISPCNSQVVILYSR